MADIQFQEPQYGTALAGPKRSWLTGLVIGTGLAKDDAGAQKVLLVVAIVVVVVGAWVLFANGGPSRPVRGPVPQGTSFTVPG